MKTPEARRAERGLTFWGRGIAGFHRIEGHPGIWVWRQLATSNKLPPEGTIQAVNREFGKEIVSYYSREVRLEAFFGLKGVKK